MSSEIVTRNAGGATQTQHTPDDGSAFYERYGFYILLFLIGAIGFYVYKDFLLLNKLYLFKDIGSDTINGFYPRLVHLADYLRSDGIPRWSFMEGMGQNIFAFSLGNPFDWPYFLMGREYIAYSIVYVELFKIALAATIFFFYLRMFSLTALVAVIGALSYAYSGFIVLGGQWHTFSTEAVHCALLLYSTELLIQRDSWRLFPVAVALVAAFQPFNLFIFGIALAFYVACRQLIYLHLNSRKLRILSTRLFAYGLLGVAISAVFSLSNCAQLLQSPRVGGGTSPAHQIMSLDMFAPASAGELVTAIMRIFSNDAIGTGDHFSGYLNYLEAPMFYIGLVNVLLLPQLFFFVEKRKKMLYAMILFLCFVPIVFPFFRYGLWLFAGNYYRIFSFLIALVLLHYGLMALNILIKERRLNVPALIGSIAVAIIVFAAVNVTDVVVPNMAVIDIVVGFLMFYSFIVFFLKVGKRRDILQAALLVGLSAELCIQCSFMVNHRPVLTAQEQRQKLGYNDYTNDVISFLAKTDRGFYRIEKDYGSGLAETPSLNDAKVQRYNGTSSYNSFNQINYIRFLEAVGAIDVTNELETRWSLGLRNSPLLMTFASVKYLLTKGGEYRTNQFIRNIYSPIGKFGDILLLRNSTYLSPGLAYEKYITMSDFNKLSTSQKRITLMESFVVDKGDEPWLSEYSRFHIDKQKNYHPRDYRADVKERSKGAISHMVYDNNNISGTLNLQEKKFIVLTIPYDKGWQAIVDGNKVALMRVDIGLMGFPVKAGEHTIELHFRPKLPWYGLAITLISLILYVIWSRLYTGGTSSHTLTASNRSDRTLSQHSW